MFLYILLVFLLICICGVYCMFPAYHTAHDKRLDTHYAHRGLWNETIPENSLSAFASAADSGYGIELDLQLSADGVVFVCHDHDLFRMTGIHKSISSCTAAELDKLRLNGTTEKIPRFTEVLSLVAGRVPLLIELKGESLNTALCPAVNHVLSTYDGPYCVESFNPILLRWYKKNRPDIYRGLLYTNTCQDLRASLLNLLLTSMLLNFICRPQFLAYHDSCRSMFPVRFLRRFQSLGFYAWTIRDPAQLNAVTKDHAYAIFENILP